MQHVCLHAHLRLAHLPFDTRKQVARHVDVVSVADQPRAKEASCSAEASLHAQHQLTEVEANMSHLTISLQSLCCA